MTTGSRIDNPAPAAESDGTLILPPRLVRLAPVLALGLVLVSPCMAKRSAPKPVPPAFSARYRFEAPLDDGQVARVEAYNRSDGVIAWTVVVFTTRLDPRLEEDVQWRFISKLAVVGDYLEVTAEDGARYRVNLTTRKVEKPAASTTP